MSGKAVAANGQGRTGARVASSAWIWRVTATVGLTVVAGLCYNEALRQRVAERWVQLSEGIRYMMLPETSKAVDDQLEAAFAPVYTAIEPFVAQIDGDTNPGLALSPRIQSAIESGLVGGLGQRLSFARDSVGRVMQTEMRAELEERFVELENWFDREVGWLPARLRTGYTRIMLNPIREEARDRLALTVNPNAFREEMGGVERSVAVRLASTVTNQLASAAFDTPAPEPGNAAPERRVPRTAWGAALGVARSAMRFVFGAGRWVGRFLPGTAIAANAIWAVSEFREWREEVRMREVLVRDLKTLVDNEKHRTKAAMLRAVNQVKSGALQEPTNR